jgi:hypothetical protein
MRAMNHAREMGGCDFGSYTALVNGFGDAESLLRIRSGAGNGSGLGDFGRSVRDSSAPTTRDQTASDLEILFGR